MKIVYSLRVYTQSHPVHLHEPPGDVLGGFVEIGPGMYSGKYFSNGICSINVSQ